MTAADPIEIFRTLFEAASAHCAEPDAMVLATVDPDGNPTARMVICRGFDPKAGWLVFYTDRESAKGRALTARPRAAAVGGFYPGLRTARSEDR